MASEPEPDFELPPELASALARGFNPSYKKKRRRWYLQKWKEKPILVPKKYNEVMKQIYDAKKRRKLEAKLEKSDEEYELELREKPKEPRKPIIEKEIEDAAWFHNLLHDLGNAVYHDIVRYVHLDGDDLKDPELATEKLIEYNRGLLDMREKAEEYLKVKQQLMGYELVYTLLKEKYEKLMDIYTVATQCMTEKSKRMALTMLALRGIVRGGFGEARPPEEGLKERIEP